MRGHHLLPVLLILVVLAAPVAARAATLDLGGFKIHTLDVKPAGRPQVTDVVTVTLAGFDKLALRDATYVKPIVTASKGSVFYSGVPRGPSLPVIHLVYTLPGTQDATVIVEPLDYSIVDAPGTVQPTPLPLPLCNCIDLNPERLEPDAKLYESTEPGILYTYYVLHENGETIIHVYVYPVHHRDGKLLVVTRLGVKIYSEPTNEQAGEAKTVLIIAPTYSLALEVAKLYKSVHPDATVIPAGMENITMAPILPPKKPLPGAAMPIFRPPEWLKEYNFTLAMKVRGFIALMKTSHRINYVLIVGGAREVPPSYYYLSLLEYTFVDRYYNAWIPTDYLYADLDLDLHPDVYVGRIPTSNLTVIARYFEKVKAYMENQKEPTVELIGGYPFGMAVPIGEAGLADYTLRGFTSHLETDYMTRTLGNYTRENFRSLFLEKPQSAWITVIAHGMGNSWADRVYNETLGMLTWEDLLTAEEILANATPRDKLAIVTSVACMNAAWDTDLAYSPWFTPPSIGEAIVEGYAGVAYLGHSRVAFEWFTNYPLIASADKGLIRVYIGGAIVLHGYLLKAWNEGASTLGEAFYRGVEEYLATPEANALYDWMLGPIVYTLGFTSVLELSLLGDPLIPLPKPLAEAKPTPVIDFKNYDVLEDYRMFRYPLAFNGTVPVYTPKSIVMMVRPAAGDIEAIGVARITTSLGLYLDSFRHMLATKAKDIPLNMNISGDMVVGIETDAGYLLYSVFGIGTLYDPVSSDHARLVVWGLDLISDPAYPVEVYLGGHKLTLAYGFGINTTVDIPQTYGVFKLRVVPRQPPEDVMWFGLARSMFLKMLNKYFTETVRVETTRGLILEVPSFVRSSGEVTIPVTILYNGKPVKATVTVGTLYATSNRYNVELEPGTPLRIRVKGEPGIYVFLVRAEYKSGLLHATAEKPIVVYIDVPTKEALAEINATVVNVGAKLENVVKSTEARVVEAISGRIAATREEIVKRIDEVKSMVGDVEDALATLERTVANNFAALASSIEGLRGHLDKVATELKTEVSSVKRSVEDVKASMEAEFSSVKEAVSNVKKSVDNLAGRVTKLESTVSSKLDTLKASMDNMNNTLNLATAASVATLAAAAIAAGAGIRAATKS